MLLRLLVLIAEPLVKVTAEDTILRVATLGVRERSDSLPKAAFQPVSVLRKVVVVVKVDRHEKDRLVVAKRVGALSLVYLVCSSHKEGVVIQEHRDEGSLG